MPHPPANISGLPAAVRHLALDSAALAAADLLRRHGIGSVLLKGAGLAHRLGVRHTRSYGDVDLLVAPAAFAAAQATLAAAGYRARVAEHLADDWELWHERSWGTPDPIPLTIDLHRGFAGVGDPEVLWREVDAGAESMALVGGAVRVPGPACAALFVALHAASPGVSVKPRADLALAVEALSRDVWTAAATVAAACAATPAFAVGLRTLPAGAALAAELNLLDSCPLDQRLVARQASRTAIGLARVTRLPTWRTRARFLGRRVLPLPGQLRHADPLARRGTAGLLLAYANRIVRHLRRLPRAVGEVRGARRADRH
ncbi:nucleotidyltransferase family protein [Micromonospora sp. RTGN7]|uniref:nucleotidyltransferase family protein n=1 Tax=Micromonospora sp. RTGN7 TaxID=3016526 RepID=UPI0029FEF03C|nr:nucleotidyltransferase family protein [Micromonospora sp. RTGN7]